MKPQTLARNFIDALIETFGDQIIVSGDDYMEHVWEKFPIGFCEDDEFRTLFFRSFGSVGAISVSKKAPLVGLSDRWIGSKCTVSSYHQYTDMAEMEMDILRTLGWNPIAGLAPQVYQKSAFVESISEHIRDMAIAMQMSPVEKDMELDWAIDEFYTAFCKTKQGAEWAEHLKTYCMFQTMAMVSEYVVMGAESEYDKENSFDHILSFGSLRNYDFKKPIFSGTITCMEGEASEHYGIVGPGSTSIGHMAICLNDRQGIALFEFVTKDRQKCVRYSVRRAGTIMPITNGLGAKAAVPLFVNQFDFLAKNSFEQSVNFRKVFELAHGVRIQPWGVK